MSLISIALLVSFLPLISAVICGLGGKNLGHLWVHRIAISLVGIAFVLSCYLFNRLVLVGQSPVEYSFYTWATAGHLSFDISMLLDRLSAVMITIVLFVSFMVHIYTMGYMKDDPGYARFYSYVSLFTFAMLILVLANNFLLLFFGWEGVGLVSYLLIGFWFKKDSAVLGGLKAFLVNRVGDVGFLLGIAAVYMFFNSLTYHQVFEHVPDMLNQTIVLWPGFEVKAINIICLLLFFSAMAKSAQVPLHVWLPESMEGPTPISALIHAATMVTAGIYMVARMSPLFEYSEVTLSFILVIGGTTAFFLGLLALTQNDIKRVIAYSTISQLGYMAAALGASSYDAAIFHLITHAFFKALLFLAAGSVIIALHHEQDMRKMGGLASYLPVTYLTFVIGSLALSAIPPFAGFFSKEPIIEAVGHTQLLGGTYAYFCLLAGAFLTPLYTFRALFMTFHGNSHLDASLKGHIHESPWSILFPLVALAIPSVIVGQWFVKPMLFAKQTILGNSVFVLPEHQSLAEMTEHFQGANLMALQAPTHVVFWLALSGILTAWLFYAIKPTWPAILKNRFYWIYAILLNKFGFDAFNQKVVVQGTLKTSHLFYDVSDVKIIDNFLVNGSGKMIRYIAKTSKRLQTGYLYHYALSMILGVLVFLAWYQWG